MKTADPVLATNSETDRAFNTGVLATILGMLGGVTLLYYFSVLSFTEMVVWGVLGVPAVAFLASIVLAWWLGYADEAEKRSLRYAVQLNYDADD